MIDRILEQFARELDRFVELLPRLVVAVVALAFLTGLGILVARGVSRILERTRRAGTYPAVARRVIRWVFVLLGLVAAFQILGLTGLAASLLATGGIVAVVFGFAFREIGENLLAGLFLAFGRSFEVGDLIESDGLRGVVRSIDLRHVHIRTADGCDIFIPSASIFRNPLQNFTRDGLRRADFRVGIDYGDDPARARQVVQDAVRATAGVRTEPPATVELAGFTSQYVELEALLWVDAWGDAPLAGVRSLAMESARDALAREGFTFSSQVTTALDLPEIRVRRPEEMS